MAPLYDLVSIATIVNLLYLAIGSAVLGVLMVCLYLVVTTEKEPNLKLSQKERYFVDPSSGEKSPFPTIDEEPTLNLSVVVPAYKEESRLTPMMKETMEYLEAKQKRNPAFSYEVIIVDDGSPDKTSEVALEYVQEYGSDTVRLLKFERNRGKGGAVRMGMLSARGETMLMVDADGATEFKDLDRLEKALKTDAPDWVRCLSRCVIRVDVLYTLF
jgi:dolichyl-phosphate beta-glucosyltransferase